MRRTNCYVVLTQEEIRKNIPYEHIAKVKTSPKWNKPGRDKKFTEFFPILETSLARVLLNKAVLWSLIGPPERETRFTDHSLMVWKKLALFCATL